MRILIIKPDHLGDFALALPSLWEVRQHFGKDAQIDVLASDANLEWAQILNWLPNIIPIRHPRYSRPPEPSAPLLRKLFTQSLSLRKQKYDYAIELTSTVNDWVGKTMMLLAGAQERYGAEGSFDFLLTKKFQPRGGHQTSLLSHRFPQEWNITGSTKPSHFIPAQFHNKHLHPQRILLSPWAGTVAKQWTLERWRELAQRLHRYEVGILSPPHTDERANAICEGSSARVIPTESIAQTLGILSEAGMVIAVDSSTAHFAWLTGTPLVSLFSGTTEFGRWSSLAEGIRLHKTPPCAPCHLEHCGQVHHYCMLDISVHEVVEAIEKISLENK